jgi:tryptophan synthase alpha chain
MAAAGAEAFEVGIPYADPMMDGPTIQAGNQRALEGGMTLERGLEVVEGVVTRTGKPVIVMTYANPIHRLGPAVFARRCRKAGASAVIVADLPLEEAAPIQGPVEEAGLGMVLFAAPTASDERLKAIAAAEPVFIYGIADLGVTGERSEAGDRAARLATRIRAVTDVPLVMGVGISTPDQARRLKGRVDGVIVGSALVRRVIEATDEVAALADVRAAVGDLVEALL